VILKLTAQLYKEREVPVYRINPEDKLYFPPPPSWRNSPPVGQGLLIVEASRSHSVGPLWMSEKSDAEAST